MATVEVGRTGEAAAEHNLIASAVERRATRDCSTEYELGAAAVDNRTTRLGTRGDPVQTAAVQYRVNPNATGLLRYDAPVHLRPTRRGAGAHVKQAARDDDVSGRAIYPV